MPDINSELARAAAKRVSLPFKHHFQPYNVCMDGRATLDYCMERGMDPSGFDCSGLVIASLCDVLGIDPENWPREFRHAAQLEQFARDEVPMGGDILFYYDRDTHKEKVRTHLGIFVADNLTIHAHGNAGVVTENTVVGYSEFTVIPAQVLHDLVAVGAETVATCAN